MLGMLFILFRKYRDQKSSLIKAFYRDGVSYFACLSAAALTNIVLNVASVNSPGSTCILVRSLSYKCILGQPEAVLHAILSTRMLLHLRSVANGQANGVPGSNDEKWGAVYNTAGREYSIGHGRSDISTMRFA
ncbi:hypothetical protein H1R20_g6059, partial [Candolleomyces eurysporus]